MNFELCVFFSVFRKLNYHGNKHEKLFFFYPEKSIGENNEDNKNFLEQLINECEKLSRQCDELKVKNYIEKFL